MHCFSWWTTECRHLEVVHTVRLSRRTSKCGMLLQSVDSLLSLVHNFMFNSWLLRTDQKLLSVFHTSGGCDSNLWTFKQLLIYGLSIPSVTNWQTSVMNIRCHSDHYKCCLACQWSGSAAETFFQNSFDMGWMLPWLWFQLVSKEQAWCCPECHLPLENDILDIRVAHYLPQLMIASVYK